MAQRGFLFGHHRPGTDRSDLRIILLIVIFSLLIITSLIMMIWNHKKTGEEMSVSVKRNSEMVKVSRECISGVGMAHRMHLNLAIIVDSLERIKITHIRDSSLAKSEKAFASLKKYYNQDDKNAEELLSKIQLSKQEYIKASDEFITLTKLDDRKKISDYLLKILKPKYETCQDQQKQVYEGLTKDLMVKTEEITGSSGSFL